MTSHLTSYHHPVIRTQIQLTEAQAEALKRVAADRGVSMAEMIRTAVGDLLAQGRVVSPDERRARALDVIGRFASGGSDASEEHDRYVAESFERP